MKNPQQAQDLIGCGVGSVDAFRTSRNQSLLAFSVCGSHSHSIVAFLKKNNSN